MKKNYFLLLLLPFTATYFIFSCKKTDCENCTRDNTPPIADAGVDSTIVLVLPKDSLTLDGRSSYDPDGNIKEYLWSKVWGPSAYSITNPKSVTTSVKNLTTGDYQFELKVTNADGLIARDTVRVKINNFFPTQS